MSTRREFFAGATIGSGMLGKANLVQANPGQGSANRRRLTCIEVPKEDWDEWQRLIAESDEANRRVHEYGEELRRKFGADQPGIYVQLEDGWAMVRDQREEWHAKQQVETENAGRTTYPTYPIDHEPRHRF